jgi:hypothetical protein
MTMLANRAQLVDTYINKYIDEMTLTDKEEMLYGLMESDLEDISDEQLIREISDTYPELLG